MRKLIIALGVVALIFLGGCSSDDPTIDDGPSISSETPDVGTEGGSKPPTNPKGDKPDTGMAKFGQTFSYEDGLKVSVLSVKRAAGGVIATVKITNGSEDTFDTADVTVNASYGKDGQQADSSYMLDTDDMFQGNIRPNGRKTATFSFKIPRSGLSDIVIEVSPTYETEAAIFQGSAS
jgi:hypothetical protein